MMDPGGKKVVNALAYYKHVLGCAKQIYTVNIGTYAKFLLESRSTNM